MTASWRTGGLAIVVGIVATGAPVDMRQAAAPAAPAPKTASSSWTRVDGGPGTACSDGSPYAFYVRRGSPDRLLVYLQGGGACWSGRTCGPELDTYKHRVSDRDDPAFAGGVFAAGDTRNPFAGDTMVFVPYCTGDVHLGGRRTLYEYQDREKATKTIQVAHAGWMNVTAALAWTYTNVRGPQSILVAGTSAGSIPSPVVAAIVAERYPRARVAQLGDASGGYRTAGPIEPNIFDAWGTLQVLPPWPGLAGQRARSLSFEALTLAAARHQPRVRFATFDTAEDKVQRFFLTVSNNPDASLLPRLDQVIGTLKAGVPIFHHYLAGGRTHGTLTDTTFYTHVTGGIALRDWVARLAQGEQIEDVRCTDCMRPELLLSQSDTEILERATTLVQSEANWIAVSSDTCEQQDAARRWTVSCLLRRASLDATGRWDAKASAVEELRYQIVETAGVAPGIDDELARWSGKPPVGFGDFQQALTGALTRVRARVATESSKR